MVDNYVIICRELASNLSIAVQDFIKDGWQPYGNPYATKGAHYQAMVKNKKPEAQITFTNVPKPHANPNSSFRR